MDEKKQGISRRDFAKVGLGAAALTFAGAKMVSASGNEFNDLFKFEVKNMIPMKAPNSHLVIGKSKIKLYKDKTTLYIDRYVELNGCASLIMQVCNGVYSCENILLGTANIYGVSPSSIENKIYEFLKQLFDEGYICFVSNNLLSGPEKKSGKGLIIRETNDPIPKITKIAKK